MKNKSFFYLTFLCILTISTIIIFHVKAEQAEVGIAPQNQTIPELGLSFTINITIQNVNDLYGWELKLYYPNDILNGTQVTQGPMLKKGGALTFFYVHIFNDNYNETHGLINVLCTRVQSEAPGVDGDGVLVIITFKTKSTSSSKILHLEDVKLSDSNANQIPCTTSDGTITVIPEFPTAYILPALILLALAATLAKIMRLKNKQENRISKHNKNLFSTQKQKLTPNIPQNS